MSEIEKQQQETNKKQKEANLNFTKLADVFIAQANKECDKADHQLVNAALLYASARFSAFITASMSESKENFESSVDSAVEFYSEEFIKMLKEHMKQYGYVLEKELKKTHNPIVSSIESINILRYTQYFL